MKICIIANGYPCSREPQWGCFERDQALALQQLGHEVSMLYVDGRFRNYKRKVGLTHFEDEGVSVYGYFLMPQQWLRRLSYKLNTRLSMWLIEKTYKKYVEEKGRPDVIYAHYLRNIALGAYLKKKYNVPVVGIEHWSELTKKTITPLVRYYGNIGYFGVDKLLSVSKSLQSHIKHHFGVDSTIVYDMLGQEFIASTVNDGKTAQFRFVAVGSLVAIKNYTMLIRAFAKSGLKEFDCSLSIAGDGPEHQKLEDAITSYGLKDNVFLLGRKTKEEIVNLLSESHVFVLSSQSETFGVACIEALSLGLPAICTKCGGPEEFIDETNGMLIEPNDVDAMASALRTVYDNFSKYDSLAIAEKCRSRFAPEVIAKQLTEIMGGVISNL